MKTLQIRITPGEYEIDVLIKRLRYLETKECRKEFTEERRVAERAVVTRQFREAIILRDSLNCMFRRQRMSKMDSEDDIYN